MHRCWPARRRRSILARFIACISATGNTEFKFAPAKAGGGAREMRWNLVWVSALPVTRQRRASQRAPRDRLAPAPSLEVFHSRRRRGRRRAMSLPGPWTPAVATPLAWRRWSGALHAQSRPSLLDCSASNENSHARDACNVRRLATRSNWSARFHRIFGVCANVFNENAATDSAELGEAISTLLHAGAREARTRNPRGS
jgi:hypothetical protein